MSIQKTLYRDGPYAALFSQGVQVGNTLHMAGQVGTDASGKAPEPRRANEERLWARRIGAQGVRLHHG